MIFFPALFPAKSFLPFPLPTSLRLFSKLSLMRSHVCLPLLRIGDLQAVCFFPCRLCGFYVPVNRVLLLQTDTLCNVLSLEGSAPYVLVPFSSKALDSRRRVLVCKLKTNSMRQVTQLIHTRFSQWRRPSW
jgi:hypothetical protein